MTSEINIGRIKEVASNMGEPIRTLILAESDSLTPAEYFAKSDLWLKLIKGLKQR